MLSPISLLAAACVIASGASSPLVPRAPNTAVVNLNQNTGAIGHLASGLLYGLPDAQNQIPSSFYSDMGFNYFRGGGAQTGAPGRGWIWGLTEYKNRFNVALSNYRTAIQNGGKVVFLIHDLWGADGTQNSSAPYPGDNGDWTSWDRYLNQFISDMNANGATSNLIIDIWNEPDLTAFWNRSQDQYLQMWGRTYYKFRQAWGTKVLLSGAATSQEPLANSGWWNNYMRFVSGNGSVPDQWAWHEETGGGDMTSATNGLKSLLNTYKLPSKPVNINEYAIPKEQVPAGTAWWISQFERVNAIGLRGNWLSGSQLRDFFASLLGKTDVNNPSGTGYYTNGDYQVYKYYNRQMTGHRVGTSPSEDLRLDVYGTVNGKAAKLLFGVRPSSTGTWYLQINGLSALGLPTSGSLPVRTLAFPFNGGFGRVDAPTDKGVYTHTYSGDTLTLAVYQTDATTAFAWEFSA